MTCGPGGSPSSRTVPVTRRADRANGPGFARIVITPSACSRAAARPFGPSAPKRNGTSTGSTPSYDGANESTGPIWPFGEDPDVEPDDWEERTRSHWRRTPLIILLATQGRTDEATQLIREFAAAAPTRRTYDTIAETLEVLGDHTGARFWRARR